MALIDEKAHTIPCVRCNFILGGPLSTLDHQIADDASSGQEHLSILDRILRKEEEWLAPAVL